VAGMGVLPQAPTTPTSMPEKEIVVPLKVTACEDPQWLEEATHEPLAEHLIVMGRVIGGQVPPPPVQESTCRVNV
jgi:hypothetical protein